MKIPGSGKLQRTVRRLQKRLASKAVILMYHRVAEVDLDPWSLCVTPQHFTEQLEVLKNYACPMSLLELVQAYQENKLPNRAVAVTFDDGYADNLYNAKPLLERYNIPATVFVTTGCIGQEHEFWWDELEQLFLQPGKLPERLCLRINGSAHQWELGAAADYSKEDYQRDRNLKPWNAKPGSRLFFYYSIWQQLLPLPARDRREVLDEIITWSGTKPLARSTYRSLLPEEVSALGSGDLVEVGAHTVTHPFLSAQSTDLQRHEIQQSKTYLEEILACPVTSFSYPFGDRNSETVRLVQEARFACACSTTEDIVWQHSDCFQLPRFEVQDWDGEEFTQQLLR